MNKTLENSLNKWSNSTDLEFVYVNSSNADIQIKFEKYVFLTIVCNNRIYRNDFYLSLLVLMNAKKVD